MLVFFSLQSFCEKISDSLFKVFLHIICCLSLSAFKILPLTFDNLIIMCLVWVSLSFILFGTGVPGSECLFLFPGLGNF